MGAAWLAARHVKYALPRDDSALCQVFYTYTPEAGHNGVYTNGASSNDNTNEVRSNVNGLDINKNGVDSNKSEVDSKLNGHGYNGTAEKVNGDIVNGVNCGCDKWKNWSLL